jgi:hypothetical protein
MVIEAKNDFEKAVLDETGDLGTLLVEKNRAYGDSVNKNGALIRNLFPEGIPPGRYEEFLIVVRMLDKIARICRGNNETFNEDAWKDLAGYAMLRVAQNKVKEQE